VIKNTEPDQKQLSTGQRLQEAREQKGISVEMVAQRLRLDVKFIQALDNDDYEQFPALTYVRGHIRGYANMVGLNPEELTCSLDHKAKIAPSLKPSVSQPQQQAGLGDKPVKVVTWSLITALVLLLGLWWHTHRSSVEETTPVVEDSAPVEPASGDTPNLKIIEGGTGTLSLPKPEKVQEKPPAQDKPEELKHEFGVQHFSDLPKPPEQSEPTDIPISRPVTEQNWVDVSQKVENSQAVNPIISSANPAQIEKQDIVLQFTDKSWVKITDSTGDKLFSRLGNPGEVVNVAGTAPFRVVIGRASVVIMSYQENFIDLDPLTKNEVARFTLDENGAHR